MVMSPSIKRRRLAAGGDPAADWGQIFNEPVVAAAIVDCLLHNATVLNIRGHSYRMRGYHADLRDDRLAGELKAAKGHL